MFSTVERTMNAVKNASFIKLRGIKIRCQQTVFQYPLTIRYAKIKVCILFLSHREWSVISFGSLGMKCLYECEQSIPFCRSTPRFDALENCQSTFNKTFRTFRRRHPYRSTVAGISGENIFTQLLTFSKCTKMH